MRNKCFTNDVEAGVVLAQEKINKINANVVGAFIARPQKTNQRGITLITLVVTIIIMLILAGVTISVIFSDNGLLSKARNAAEQHKISAIKEEIEIEISDINADKLVNGEKLTKEQALIEIEKRGKFEEIDLKESTGIKDGYVITLGYDKNGNVIITDIQKDAGVRLTIKQEPTGYTNGTVKVTIGLSKEKEKIVEIEAPEGMVKNEDGTYTIERNGTYKVKVKISSGENIEKDIVITTIDKLPPKEFTPEVTVDNGIIKIKENGEDEEAKEESIQSGIDYYEYYVKNTSNEETKYETSEIAGLVTGKYKVYVIAYDKAGNHTKSEEVEVQVEEWIKIYNEEDLRNIANGLTKNYVLMNDIELTEEWTATGDFTGKLEGAGYKICGLNVNTPDYITGVDRTSSYKGLFGSIGTEGKVSNLTLDGSVCGYRYVGILTGENRGTLENIKVSGTLVYKNKNSSDFGGLVGQNYGLVEKCYSDVSIGDSPRGGNWNSIGGLVGVNYGKIKKSKSSGVVFAAGCRWTSWSESRDWSN